MMDKIEFKIINPKGKERWADEYPPNIRVVEIYINGKELIDILKEIEYSYDPKLAGAYGHQTPEDLYSNLVEGEDSADLLCCSDCGDIGCWTVRVIITADEKYVYWINFSHHHREWKYDISYTFEKTAYEKALNYLKEKCKD